MLPHLLQGSSKKKLQGDEICRGDEKPNNPLHSCLVLKLSHLIRWSNENKLQGDEVCRGDEKPHQGLER